MMARGRDKEKKSGELTSKTFLDVFNFMKSLYGILTLISIVFPSINVFWNAIPLEKAVKYNNSNSYGPGLLNFSPAEVGAITSIVILFFIFLEFNNRYNYIDNTEKYGKDNLIKSILKMFIFGIAFLMAYLYVYEYNIINYFPRDFVLFFLYLGSFTCIAVAFMRLSLMEYFKMGITQHNQSNA